MRRAFPALSLTVLLAAPVARAQSQSTPQPDPTAATSSAQQTGVTATATATAAPAPAPAQKPPSPVVTKWSATLYGFAELDAIYDTREAMTEVPGNPSLPRSGTYGASHDRLQESMRNSRIGFRFTAPEYRGMKASGLIETDFFGNQPNTAGGGSEAGFYNNAGLRVRHAYAKLETPAVDLVAGQTWELFGWQPYSHPNTLELQGVPGQVYSRTTQLRLSHTFRSQPVDFEVAVAAARPVQRDSGTPDGQAGARLVFNQWKSVRTAGGTGTSVDPLFIGVSGVWRKLVANAGNTDPTKSTTAHGWGVSIDGLVPVIPATLPDRSNALTLTGSWVKGEAIQDMYSGFSNGASGGSTNQLGSTNALDAGLAAFDSTGKLVPVKVESYIAGVQYYLPVDGGTVWVAGTYSQTRSDNAATVLGATKAWKEEKWVETALFWDATPQVRFGASWGWFEDTYGDNQKAHDNRYQLSAFYLF